MFQRINGDPRGVLGVSRSISGALKDVPECFMGFSGALQGYSRDLEDKGVSGVFQGVPEGFRSDSEIFKG